MKIRCRLIGEEFCVDLRCLCMQSSFVYSCEKVFSYALLGSTSLSYKALRIDVDPHFCGAMSSILCWSSIKMQLPESVLDRY